MSEAKSGNSRETPRVERRYLPISGDGGSSQDQVVITHRFPLRREIGSQPGMNASDSEASIKVPIATPAPFPGC